MTVLFKGLRKKGFMKSFAKDSKTHSAERVSRQYMKPIVPMEPMKLSETPFARFFPNPAETKLEHGGRLTRAWKAGELRLKDTNDLQAIWFECLRERDALRSEFLFYKQIGFQSPSLHKIFQVKKTMGAIKTVIAERRAAKKMIAFHDETWRDAKALVRNSLPAMSDEQAAAFEKVTAKPVSTEYPFYTRSHLSGEEVNVNNVLLQRKRKENIARFGGDKITITKYGRTFTKKGSHTGAEEIFTRQYRRNRDRFDRGVTHYINKLAREPTLPPASANLEFAVKGKLPENGKPPQLS